MVQWSENLVRDAEGLGHPIATTEHYLMTYGNLGTGCRTRMVIDDRFDGLTRAVNELPVKQKAVLLAEYFVAGEAADKWHSAGVPRTTYYRLLARAKAALMEQICGEMGIKRYN